MKSKQPLLLRAGVRVSLGLLMLIGLCITLGVQVRPAHAATTITVSTCDESHLDAAITQANTDNAGDTITFSCSGDITLTSTLTITGSMTLDGSGQNVTLDGGGSRQILNVNNGVSLTLNALIVSHGSNPSFSGGGLDNNGGTVTISNSTFDNNTAAQGGGLRNEAGGTVTITNSTFANNTTPGGSGGGLLNDGVLSITNSTITNNNAVFPGGGLFNDGSMSITNSTITNNSSDAGGGLFNQGGSPGPNSGVVTITNSTFANNSVGSGDGGGLDNAGGTLNITNSTVANNAAGRGGGLFNDNTLNIGGSIVGENTGGDCGQFGSISDQGYNLSSDGSCGFTGTGDAQNTNPQLSALANNGGPTQTIALQQGSPAIDAGPPSAKCPTTDQRGDARPDNGEGACDMGAYEFSDPSLTALGMTVSATEGVAFSGVVASGTYSGGGTLSATITWGDGSATSAGSISGNSSFTVSGSHTYAEEGSYTIMISVSDGQRLSASASSSATVSDAALMLTHFLAGSLPHHSAAVAATFTDADPAGTVSDYTATINWGDGTTSTVKVYRNPLGKGFVLAGLHNYASKGTYNVTLTIADQGGSQVSKTVTLIVK